MRVSVAAEAGAGNANAKARVRASADRSGIENEGSVAVRARRDVRKAMDGWEVETTKPPREREVERMAVAFVCKPRGRNKLGGAGTGGRGARADARARNGVGGRRAGDASDSALRRDY